MSMFHTTSMSLTMIGISMITSSEGKISGGLMHEVTVAMRATRRAESGERRAERRAPAVERVLRIAFSFVDFNNGIIGHLLSAIGDSPRAYACDR